MVVFTVSYPLGLSFNFVVSSLVSDSALMGLYLPRVVTVLAPAIAACLVAASGGGVIRLRELLRSCRVPRRSVPATTVIVAAPLVLTIVAFVLAGLPLAQMLAWITSRSSVLAAHFIIQCVVIGLGEELGWRGWLLPSLARQRSFASAAAWTGIVWMAWHGPVFFSAVFVAMSFVILLSSLAVVYAWLWKRSGGSVGIVAIAHGAVNAPFFFFETAIRNSGADEQIIIRAFFYQAMFCACLALISVAADRRIWLASKNQTDEEAAASVTAA